MIRPRRDREEIRLYLRSTPTRTDGKRGINPFDRGRATTPRHETRRSSSRRRGATRRSRRPPDEKKSRAGSRPSPLGDHGWIQEPAPRLWSLYNPRVQTRRVYPRFPRELTDSHLAIHPRRESTCALTSPPTAGGEPRRPVTWSRRAMRLLPTRCPRRFASASARRCYP